MINKPPSALVSVQFLKFFTLTEALPPGIYSCVSLSPEKQTSSGIKVTKISSQCHLRENGERDRKGWENCETVMQV